jgi:mannose-6-phosphate isomerase-like protein (cupin superfamily)
MKVEHWNIQTDGPLSEQAMRNKLRDRGYSVTCYHYPPSTYFPDHTHEVDKIDAVLAGQFRMTMDGQSFVLKAGDCLAVPKRVIHSAEVVGNETVVSLDAVRNR